MKNNILYYGIGILAVILIYNYFKKTNLPASRINKHTGTRQINFPY